MQSKVYGLFRRVNQTWGWIERAFLIYCLCIILGLIVYEVLSRNVEQIPFFSGLEEMAILASLWLYFIGSAYASREGAQISVNILDLIRMPSRAKRYLDGLGRLVTIMVCGATAYYIIGYIAWVHGNKMKLTPLGWPQDVLTFSFGFGLVLMTLYALSAAVNWIKTGSKVINSNEISDDARLSE